MSTTRRILSEKQLIELGRAFMLAGATTRDASEIIKHDWLPFEMMKHGRSKMDFHVSTEERDLAEMLDEKRFFGTKFAFEHFGALVDERWYASIENQCAVIASQMRMLGQNAENRAVFWMPPLSLNDLMVMLPDKFFDLDKRSFLKQAQCAKANADKMAPGFRMFQIAEWAEIERERRQPTLTELAYMHTCLSLTRPWQEMSHAGTISFCLHGAKNPLRAACMFANWRGYETSPFRFYDAQDVNNGTFGHHACHRYEVRAA